MKKINKLTILFVVFFIISFVTLYAETQSKTDFKIGAKIIGVADPDYKEFSYIDMGSAHGVKPGDRFMVEGKYGKVMVEVVQAFQRMSAVKIVDSWLLNEGNVGEMIPASRYPKIRINKYVEKAKKDTVLASKKLTPKKSKPKVTAKVEKVEEKKEVTKKVEETLPEEVSAEALIPQESTEVVTPSFEGIPQEQEAIEFPEAQTTQAEALTEIPGEEMPVGEMETTLPGEQTLPSAGEPTLEELGIPADAGTEPSLSTDTGAETVLPTDAGAEPALPADIGAEPTLPADNTGNTGSTESALPTDDLSVMPGDALPSMP
ncbi:MAG: hypothetical protein N3E50_05860 [Candidatus Goldbacteria bacterium]|nr:hypothetical protein [Candidatus Goldiibacteriota bacterium]